MLLFSINRSRGYENPSLDIIVTEQLFRVMCFPHNGSIVTIDQLEFDNHHPNSALVQATPLYGPSFHVDSTPP
jgi:hypothetical protein